MTNYSNHKLLSIKKKETHLCCISFLSPVPRRVSPIGTYGPCDLFWHKPCKLQLRCATMNSLLGCSESQHTAAAVLSACPWQGCALPRCPGQAGGTLPAQPSSTPTPAVLLGNSVTAGVPHTAAVAFVPTQKPNHCPSTLHKNPHQFRQPSNCSRSSLSPMEKEMLHYEGGYVKSISNITMEHLCHR